MKKYFLTFINVFLITLFVFAQSNNFRGGVFLNPNGIHFAGDNQIFWQSQNGKVWGGGGISGGIYVKRDISKKVYFGLELRYIQKGSVFEYGNQFGSRSVETMRINYAEIPVLIGYTFQINKKNYFLETGIAYAKELSSKLHINELTSQNEYSNIDNFKDNDLSWINSIKFSINKKRKNNLLLGLRMSYSLKSIHKYYNIRNMTYGVQFDYLINQ